MKTSKQIFALLLIVLFAFSCTPNAIDQDDTKIESDTFATGGDGGASTDDDRDGNGGG